jgi:pyrroloquinoline quinone biosynthesis protein B
MQSPLLSQGDSSPFILVLGTAQDGGYPHIGCQKQCCTLAWAHDSLRRYVVSLALVDPAEKRWWLFEATPDIKEQLKLFQTLTHGDYRFLPDGIFITHAHIGHYTGLMQLGKEALHTQNVPVFVLPKMRSFLENNGPWSQLVKLKNIVATTLTSDKPLQVSARIEVTAFLVPHRDEYSETAGFRIATPARTYLFIPDIDKWSKFDRNIVAEVKRVDVAFLDATFFSSDELPNRKIEEVPHPLVIETMKLFENEDRSTRRKIVFIHFNHTNPLLWDDAKKTELRKAGYDVGFQGMRK